MIFRINLNMKSLLLKIKNMFPYLLLIALYFFFINIEARKKQINNEGTITNKDNNTKKSNIYDSNLRISIPVIPYSQ